MDKKDRDLIMKIGKRLGIIEKELIIIKKNRVQEQVVEIADKPKEKLNVIELGFYLQLGEKEVTQIHNAFRDSILEIMKKTGIKSMRCNISQE